MRNNRKVVAVIAMLAAGIAGSIFVAAGLAGEGASARTIPRIEIGKPFDTSEMQIDLQGIGNDAQEAPSDLLAEGKGAIVVDVLAGTEGRVLDARRGVSLTIPLSVTYHKVGSTPDLVGVQFDRIPTTVYPASVASAIIEEQRLALNPGAKLPEGGIALTNFVKVTPSAFTLKDGEEISVNMQITIPSGLTDELIGSTLTFEPLFKLTDEKLGQDIGVLVPAVDVKVTE